MIEIIKLITDFWGEHVHPNMWTAFAGSPIIASTVYYIKCKCGGWFQHTKDCKHETFEKK